LDLLTSIQVIGELTNRVHTVAVPGQRIVGQKNEVKDDAADKPVMQCPDEVCWNSQSAKSRLSSVPRTANQALRVKSRASNLGGRFVDALAIIERIWVELLRVSDGPGVV
jgi:hypothetical protein